MEVAATVPVSVLSMQESTALVHGDTTEFSEHDAPLGPPNSASDSDVEVLWDSDLESAGASPEINAHFDSDTLHAHGGSASDDGYGDSVRIWENAAIHHLPSQAQVHDSQEPEPNSRKRPYHLVDPPLRELNILRMAKTHASIMAANYTDPLLPKFEFRVGPTGMSVPPNASQKRRKLISDGPDGPEQLRRAEVHLRLNALANRADDADMGFRLNWNRAPTTNHNRVRPFLLLERQANSPVSDSEESTSTSH